MRFRMENFADGRQIFRHVKLPFLDKMGKRLGLRKLRYYRNYDNTVIKICSGETNLTR